MKKTYIYLLFSIMVIAQIAVAGQIVYKYERTIASNNMYKFKTAPIDPNDPFRGKYIALRYEINSFATTDDDWEYDQKAYVYISKDEDGFAVLETVSKTLLPNTDFDYIEVDNLNYYSGKVHFELPFNRYYMEESKAYDAETLAREAQRGDAPATVYAVVHIENNLHVLIDIVVNGVSIKEAVAK
ncbi:GDYXXLXY domain-containing protein [Kordia zhangzhouensis]|uniref:GDYXXLXY domain-containing protein n=1 Tax=Kordia zhangzhouensis TaxID=1620405 RepID=UPI0009E5F33B|nr:GDYXXLXY domain-containing protein [Kordia zhangzhouensis]